MATVAVKTRQEFEEQVVKSDKVVLVDFWAAWCPPCRMMSPVLELLAEKHADSLSVVKVNVEDSADNQQIAAEHGVSGIPNMQVFRGGEKVDELIGARPQDVLEEELIKHMKQEK